MKKRNRKNRTECIVYTPPMGKSTTHTDDLLTEGRLLRRLRARRSYREFEKYLNEHISLGMPGTTSFQSIWNWTHDVYPVNDASLMAWLTFYGAHDPRHQLGMEILALRKREYKTDVMLSNKAKSVEKNDSTKMVD